MDHERLLREARMGDIIAARMLYPEVRRRGERDLQIELADVVMAWVGARGAKALWRQGGGEAVRIRALSCALRSDHKVMLVEPERLDVEWSPRLARLWAADVAERAVWLVERAGGGRAQSILETARGYARGEVGREALDGAQIWAEETVERVRFGSWKVTDAAQALRWSVSPQRIAPGAVCRAVVSALPREKRWAEERLLGYLCGRWW